MSKPPQIQTTAFDDAVEAIITGDATTLSNLLTKNPQLVHEHSRTEHQATLLHYVSANGVEDNKQITPDNVLEVAEILLKAGANPNQVSNIYGGGTGSTALCALVSSSHPAQAGKQADLVRLFCQYANPDGVNNELYPLATAIAFRYPKAVQALVDSGATVDNIVSASAVGNYALVKELFDSVLPPYTNSFGTTFTNHSAIKELALSASCMAGHLEIVHYLVENGVDVDARTSVEKTSALVEASICGHSDIVTYLLENDADVISQDHIGFTALHWATWHGHLDSVDILLEHNAPLEIVNTYGGTVIDTAVYGYANTYYPVPNQLETLQRLIDAGADVSNISPYPSGNQQVDSFLEGYIV